MPDKLETYSIKESLSVQEGPRPHPTRTRVPQRAVWGASVCSPVCSGHLYQLTSRLWPQRDTGKRDESGLAAELPELAVDTRLGFPKLHREQGPLSELGLLFLFPGRRQSDAGRRC